MSLMSTADTQRHKLKVSTDKDGVETGESHLIFQHQNKTFYIVSAAVKKGTGNQ